MPGVATSGRPKWCCQTRLADHHAWRQRVGGAGNRLRELQPTAALRPRGRVRTGQYAQESSRNDPAPGFRRSPRRARFISAVPASSTAWMRAGAGGALALSVAISVSSSLRRAASASFGSFLSAALAASSAFLCSSAWLHFLRRARERAVHCLRVVERRRERVVIGLWDRVEHVVVASRATNRQGEEAAGHGVHAVIERFGPGLRHALRVAAVGDVRWADREEPRCGRGFPPVAGQVTGNLVLHELVVGQVIVECLNDPVTIAPRFGQRGGVEETTVAVAVPGDIEPVTPPPFAVLRRSEQPVDQLRVGVRGVIGDECLNLFRRRRQTDEIEVGASADQCSPVGGWGRASTPSRLTREQRTGRSGGVCGRPPSRPVDRSPSAVETPNA